MDILILGSEGFIGSNAVEYFKAKEYHVTGADIVFKEAADYIVVDPNETDFSDLFNFKPFDICLNASGAANVQFSFANPGIDYRLNATNVYAILNGIHKNNPGCKFINLSSAAVYGNPTSSPINESAQINPLSPYGHHKWYSEQICAQFHKLYGLETISLRIFSAYGKGLKKQLFWDLYNKIKNESGTIDLFGTGNESRDFIFISDILDAIICVIDNAVFNGMAINIASGTESTIKEVAELFTSASNKKVRLNFIGVNKIGDPLNWKGDISLLKSLGFAQKISLKEGINRYCEWLEKN